MDQYVIDKHLIGETIRRYAGAVPVMDEAAFSDCWAEHAEWIIVDRNIRGRNDIVAAWKELSAPFAIVVQYPTITNITLAGAEARARSSILEVGKFPDGSGVVMSGSYIDDLVREPDGVWRFSRREYELLIVLPAGIPIA